jgi:arylsulfatase A-like enzyme
VAWDRRTVAGLLQLGDGGSIRTPFMVRWPGRIPAGRVSNEIVHGTDVFTTVAHAAGAPLPTDRAIDGVNQLPFLERQPGEVESLAIYTPRRRSANQ